MSNTKNQHLLLSLSLLCFKGVIGDEVRITSEEEFYNFVSSANSGKSKYNGKTVLLDSDLSLSGKTTLEPIGKDTNIYFIGTFDGQGHIISDLKMNTSSRYTGLFGYSGGLTIRNVVLDSSCSIASTYIGLNSFLGGIIGSCSARNEQCNIENSVNMAGVTFTGNITEYYGLRIGGITGELSSTSYTIYVKNCVNYGTVTQSGASDGLSYIGGIAGRIYTYGYNYTCLYNSINYGAIIQNATISNTIYIGGITGYSYYAHIENCVSAGKISTTGTSPESYVGGAVGGVGSNTYTNYCYYTSELNEYNRYGYGAPITSSYTLSYNSTTFELSDDVSIGNFTGTSLVNALNVAADYYVLRDYSHWLINKEKKSVAFIISSRTSPITMGSQIILLPSLASEGNISFDGWYSDSEYTYPLESFEITEDKTFYGRFKENTNNYTITFDTRGGSFVEPITAQFGTDATLPNDVIKEHCSVAFWENEYCDNVGLSLTMPAHNFTLYAVWKCTRITTLEDFIDFSKVVNSGVDDYNETTVFLDTDLSFSGKTSPEPIGNNTAIHFRGVFDGQGYIISDFKMNTSSKYTGLFGYSIGLTIRNVVLDSSCSMTNSYIGSTDVYAGGIIGYCWASSGDCNIEDIVNMAGITFTGVINKSYDLCIGGVAGILQSSSSYPIYVENCVNYGTVMQSGTSKYSYIGGIAGKLYGSSSSYVYLYNSINYGAITHNATAPNSLYLGGIVGYSHYVHIKNCVSAGEISTTGAPSESYIGSVVGYVSYNTHIIHCYYTSEVNVTKLCYGTAVSISNTSTSPSSVNSTLINSLNDYASSNSWSNWTVLHMNGGSVSDVVQELLANPNRYIPSPAKEGHTFDGWFTDSDFVESYDPTETSTPTEAYAKFTPNNYTLRFIFNNGAEDDVRVLGYNASVAYPADPAKEGHTFNGWDRSGIEFMPAQNTTITALWVISNYTVTLDADGGSGLAVTSVAVTFNSTYGELPTPARAGHMFVGWFTDGNESVTSDTTVAIASNHTLHARWEEVTRQVEVVFGAKDLTEEEIKELIREYAAGAEFEIVAKEVESGEVRVIVKFADIASAEEFVRNIRASSGIGVNGITRVGFTSKDANSFSSMLRPYLLLFSALVV